MTTDFGHTKTRGKLPLQGLATYKYQIYGRFPKISKHTGTLGTTYKCSLTDFNS